MFARVVFFFVNLRRILPTIGELLFASVANCLCYFTSYGVHTFLCTQPLERMPIHSNEGFMNRKWTMNRIMKKAFLAIVAFATLLLVAAQYKIKFSYDAAGNRVAREAVVSKSKVAQAKAQTQYDYRFC